MDLPQSKGISITSCSYADGLVCFHGYDHSSPRDVAVIWSPAIKKSIVIYAPYLVKEPFGSVVGFGVCPTTKDPILVQIAYVDMVYVEGLSDEFGEVSDLMSTENEVMLYTLSSNKWEHNGFLYSDRSIQFKSAQLVIGRFIYWIGVDIYDKLVVSFDMETQEFEEIYLPTKLVDRNLSISRLGDSLVVFDYKQVCDVWMMEEREFTKLYTIEIPHGSINKVLGFTKNGEPIIKIKNNGDEEEDSVVVYEPSSRDVKDLGIRGNGSLLSVNSYTESLLLLQCRVHPNKKSKGVLLDKEITKAYHRLSKIY